MQLFHCHALAYLRAGGSPDARASAQDASKHQGSSSGRPAWLAAHLQQQVCTWLPRACSKHVSSHAFDISCTLAARSAGFSSQPRFRCAPLTLLPARNDCRMDYIYLAARADEDEVEASS